MNTAKSYVLALMRNESQEKHEPKRKPMRSESRIKNEDGDNDKNWIWTPHDDGMSGCPTFHYTQDVVLQNIDGMHGDVPINELDNRIYVQAPDMDDMDPYEGEHGYFTLIYTGEAGSAYGFEADFGSDLEFMVYGYASSLDELEELVSKLYDYISLPEGIPYAKFQTLLDEDPSLHKDEDDLNLDSVDTSMSADLGSTGDMQMPDTSSMEMPDIPESAAKSESSQDYMFDVTLPCKIAVTADSEDLAKEILERLGSKQFTLEVAPDVELREIDFENAAI